MHKHPLKIEMVPYKNNFICNLCCRSFPPQRIFRCDECKYDICCECKPLKFSANLHQHELHWETTPYPSRFRCDICKNVYPNERVLRCAECQFDVCNSCRPQKFTPDLHNHILKFEMTPYEKCFECNVCGVFYPNQPIFRCNQCQFDVCSMCSSSETNIDAVCLLCRTNSPRILALPCFHLALCQDCYGNPDFPKTHCPVCLQTAQFHPVFC